MNSDRTRQTHVGRAAAVILARHDADEEGEIDEAGDAGLVRAATGSVW